MNFKIFILASTVVWITGCATTEYKPLPEAPVKKVEQKSQGVYHKVQKGETLFRIAKSYSISVEDIIEANKIPSGAALEVGQLLLIPGAKETKEVMIPHTSDENKDEFVWPIKGKVISYFKDHRGEGMNKGIDIEAAEGDTVKAVREGTVVLSDYMSEYHQTIMIDHGDGFISVYAKNRKLLAKLGDHVFKGDPIAEAGKEAGKSFLHFEIRKGKEATNPLYYLP
jgi:murein DD-endopeptidase MepM/ murein hydrolase activator NlpD